MFKRIRQECGQNIVEYAVLLCLIVASVLIMQFYVKRAYQGRLKQEADSLGAQYAPGNTNSTVVTNTTTLTSTYTGGATSSGAAVADGMTVTISNSTTMFEKKEVTDPFIKEVN